MIPPTAVLQGDDPLNLNVSSSSSATKQTMTPSTVQSVLMSNAGLCDCGPRSRTSCDPIKCNYAGVKPLNAKAAKANKVMPAQELAAASLSSVQAERNVRLSEEFEELIKDYQPKDHVLARKRKLRVTDDNLKKVSKSNPSESGSTGLHFVYRTFQIYL